MKELKAMSPNELNRQLTMLREKVRDLHFKIFSKEVKNNHILKSTKKDIARILTILRSE